MTDNLQTKFRQTKKLDKTYSSHLCRAATHNGNPKCHYHLCVLSFVIPTSAPKIRFPYFFACRRMEHIKPKPGLMVCPCTLHALYTLISMIIYTFLMFFVWSYTHGHEVQCFCMILNVCPWHVHTMVFDCCSWKAQCFYLLDHAFHDIFMYIKIDELYVFIFTLDGRLLLMVLYLFMRYACFLFDIIFSTIINVWFSDLIYLFVMCAYYLNTRIYRSMNRTYPFVWYY